MPAQTSLTSFNPVAPFHFESYAVRVQVGDDGQPWFNANDVCAALELANPRDAITKHVDPEDVAKRDTLTAGGTQALNHVNESGVYALILGSSKDAAKRFKRWVTSEVLPSIRKTGSYSLTDRPQPAQLPVELAARTFNALHSVGVTLGMQANVAAISANQGTLKLTGSNLLVLIGQTHLESAVQDIVLTPTQLGKEMSGMSAVAFNRLLEQHGYQTRVGGEWKPTDKAKGLFRLEDTGKKHNSGTPVMQLKWYSAILEQLKTA